jgi:hypothetical protein
MGLSVKSAVENKGYIFLKEYLVGKSSEDVAHDFGRPIVSVQRIHLPKKD